MGTDSLLPRVLTLGILQTMYLISCDWIKSVICGIIRPYCYKKMEQVDEVLMFDLHDAILNTFANVI